MKYFIILFAAVILQVSCKKPTDGKPGVNGNNIIQGEGIPKMSIGMEGDYYFDSKTNVLWGPKSSTNWGSGIELTGSTLLSGGINPFFSTGKINDYYLNWATKTLFGPKTVNGWGKGMALAQNLTTASFIYTTWQATAGTTKDTVMDGTAYKVRYAYPKSLTSEILTSGLMITYMRFGGTNYPLPYASFAGGKANVLNAFYGLKKVVIGRSTNNVNTAADLITMSSSLEYRHIFIPGNMAGQAAGAKSNTISDEKLIVQLPGMDYPIDLKAISYEELCAILHIQP